MEPCLEKFFLTNPSDDCNLKSFLSLFRNEIAAPKLNYQLILHFTSHIGPSITCIIVHTTLLVYQCHILYMKLFCDTLTLYHMLVSFSTLFCVVVVVYAGYSFKSEQKSARGTCIRCLLPVTFDPIGHYFSVISSIDSHESRN